ncbi:ribosome recycling factor [Longirhabdus pacifica]|uniref:ribosome recycling factor n=1 Tax=Longirhabdus pacifica TaxID=2305227 RepID=UPI0010093C47|nr:ribosome recycling factor [Longirhabdus pacifica]
MAESVKKNAVERMDKAIAALKKELTSLRAGRANPSILDRIEVDYYGATTPLNQLANISTPDARSLLIQPWDKSSLPLIEKEILKSDLGLTPSNDGTNIRITIPQLTEERRNELVKLTKKIGEEGKVAIRNIRRDSNDAIKKLEKTEITEDESRRYQEEVQKLTDQYIKKVDENLVEKEKEILEI